MQELLPQASNKAQWMAIISLPQLWSDSSPYDHVEISPFVAPLSLVPCYLSPVRMAGRQYSAASRILESSNQRPGHVGILSVGRDPQTNSGGTRNPARLDPSFDGGSSCRWQIHPAGPCTARPHLFSASVPKRARISPAGSERAALAREATLARSTEPYNPVIRGRLGTTRLLIIRQQMVQEDGVTKLTDIHMSVDAGIATCASQRRSRGFGSFMPHGSFVCWQSVGGESQIGHVDYVSPLTNSQQEVFWFDVTMVVATSMKAFQAPKKLIHQHQSRLH